jgi:hypothetical protein
MLRSPHEPATERAKYLDDVAFLDVADEVGRDLKEAAVLQPLNGWLGHLFDRDNVDRTMAALLASQKRDGDAGTHEVARKRLADAEARLRRHQAAIEAGVHPAALVDAINTAQEERIAARAELDHAPEARLITDAEIHAMIDSLGDVGAALDSGKPESMEQLYHDLGVELRYEPAEQAIHVAASPRVVSECVRGGTRTQPRGIPAHCRYPCAEASRPDMAAMLAA